MSIYYSYEKLKSYNALFNFVIAERGVGKTFGAKKEVINDFIKTGNQFIYLRRYKSELKTATSTFFDDLVNAGEYKDHTFKVKNIKDGAELYMDDQLIGWCLPLSTSGILKSTAFPNVRTIVFDEFIITKSVYHYLPDEVTQFLELVETVFRLRDNGRIWFLGNATTLSNPYFMYFELSVPYKSEYKTFKNGLILVNYVKNEEYRQRKRLTRFGQLIEGTEYGNYAIENEFLLDSNSFILKKPPDAKFDYILKVAGKTLGIWHDEEGSVFVSRAYDPNAKTVVTVNMQDHDENDVMLPHSSDLITNLQVRYILGTLYFEDTQVKYLMSMYVLLGHKF